MLYLLRLFGINPNEKRTVGLFLLHNFLLGIGSILVYVAANVLLLEHDPERSLPLGYIVGALAMMGVGKIYTYYEHHLLLKKLAVRVLLAVVALTSVVAVLVVVGHSVAAAVAIVAGYRVIYLLTSLEFWGISAVVFDVRQSKRLFGVISAGDMPAKALGALLAAMLHGTAQLPVLLGVAFAAYIGALLVLRTTLNSHEVVATARPVRRPQRQQAKVVEQLFGGSSLVFAMCLSLAAIGAVLTGVEYLFFINVKHKFHDSVDVMRSVGWVLGGTYLVTTLFKLLLSRKVFDRFGVQWSLWFLPVAAIGCLAVLGGLQLFGLTTQSILVAYSCGLYLLLEVLRRTVFDPVFLVLFQPLVPLQRLAAHTLTKGFYEPLGMGLTGALFFALHAVGHLSGWEPYAWMALLLVGALFALRRTYHYYLAELKDGLSRRFAETAELALPDAALHVVLAHLHSARPSEVLNAIAWLREWEPLALTAQAPALLYHADERVRLAVLMTPETSGLPAEALAALARRDPSPAVREKAACLLATNSPNALELSSFITGEEWEARKGAIRGYLLANPAHPAARTSLAALLSDPRAEAQTAALSLLDLYAEGDQDALVANSRNSPEPAVAIAALAAIGTLPNTRLAPHLLSALVDKKRAVVAVDSLVAIGPAAVPLLHEELGRTPSLPVTTRLALALERIATPACRAALMELAQQPGLLARAVALRALRHFAPSATDALPIDNLLKAEFALAAQLLQGVAAFPALGPTIGYELAQLQQRIFGLLGLRYDAEAVATAQRNVANAARERQANAFEILDNVIPRSIYQSLQVLLDDTPLIEKNQALTALNSTGRPTVRAQKGREKTGAARRPIEEPLPAFLLRQGVESFTPWTLNVALHLWQPGGALLLLPYMRSDDLLLRESSRVAAQALAIHMQEPISFLFPELDMSHSHPATHNRVSALERVETLKNTALFAYTPENVLSSIVPIMKEVSYQEGQEIFAKGEVGTSLYIVFDGQVGIFNGPQQLATFGSGDFFGELALLDTEPRSATAAALGEVLAFRIDQEDFFDVMEERSEVLRNILRMLCQRIRLQNEKMREMAA